MPVKYTSLWFAALIAWLEFSYVAHIPIGNTNALPALPQVTPFSFSASLIN